jgi:hypothetical protein
VTDQDIVNELRAIRTWLQMLVIVLVWIWISLCTVAYNLNKPRHLPSQSAPPQVETTNDHST